MNEHNQWKERTKCDAANAGPEPEKPVLPRVVCSDITVERLGELLEENSRGIICGREELAGWFGAFTRYKGKSGGTDLPNWLEFHRAGSATIDRKTSEKKTLFIDRAAVSVCGTIQPGILSKAVRSGDFLESGLVARLLMAMLPKHRKQWRDEDIDPATADAYEQLLDALYALDFGRNGNGERMPIALDLDAAARQVWIEFYNTFAAEQADADDERAAALAKLEGYAARFALLHHIVERVAVGLNDTAPVTVESVQAGIALTRWFSCEDERIYAMFGETAEQRNTRRLIEWIQAHGGETTVRHVQDHLRRNFPTADDARAALEELVAAEIGEWISGASGPRGGRPSERFRLCARETAPAKPTNDTRTQRDSVGKPHDEEVLRFRVSAGAASSNGQTHRDPGDEG